METIASIPESIFLKLDKNTIFGEGSLNKLGGIIKKYSNILVFTDKYGFKSCGASEYFNSIKKEFPIKEISYSGKALPTEDVQYIYNNVKNIKKIDLVIGIGGGTIIDLAKIFSLAYSNKCEYINELLKNDNKQNVLDLIFIPTTAGTGSETTSFAVVYKNKIKFSIESRTLLPKYIILDPGLLRSLPESILNATVLDALSQGVESMWAIGATPLSQEHAKEAISLILQGLTKKGGLQKLSLFQLGSHFSGKAINISKTTISHSISYPITSFYEVPHGIAVFLTLPRIAELNYKTNHSNIQSGIRLNCIKKSFSILFRLFRSKDVEHLSGQLKKIMTQLKIKKRLRDYGIKRRDMQVIASNAMSRGRSDNNPRKISKTEILKLLEEIY